MNKIHRRIQKMIAFFMAFCMLFLNGTVGWAAPLVNGPENTVMEQSAENSKIEETKESQFKETPQEETMVQTKEEAPEAEEAPNGTSELYTDDQTKASKGGTAPSEGLVPLDTAAPIISDISNTPDKDWSNTDVAVMFKVTDEAGSGVNDSEVKAKNPLGAEVTVKNESDGKYSFQAQITGIYTISAKDNAGNTATLAYTKKINIDKNAPTIKDIRIGKKGSPETTSILETPVYNYFTNANSEITVSAKDDLSGIASIDYQFVKNSESVNEASWEKQNFTDFVNPRSYTFQAEPDKSLTTQGTFVGKVYIRVKDSGGNEIRSSISLNGKYVNEKINPSAASMTPVDSSLDLKKWQSDIEFNLSAADAESGLSKIEIYNGDTLVKTVTLESQADGLGQFAYDTKDLEPAEGYTATTPGQYDVYLKAYDKSGNVLKSKVQRVKICKAVPALKVTPETEKWTNQNSVLTLSNTEGQVQSSITYYYQKSGEAVWTKIDTVGPHASTTFTFSEPENQEYSFKAVTETEKESLIVTKDIKIDKEAPKPATIDTKIQGEDSLNVPDGKNDWYVKIPSIIITPPTTEGELNAVTTKYRFAKSSDFEKAEVIDYSGTAPVITEDGIYKIDLFTEDEAGNESTHTTREIKVDQKAPDITKIALNDPKDSSSDVIETIWHFFTGKIGVNIEGNDLTSGVGEVYYQVVKVDGSDVEEDIKSGPWTKGDKMEIAPQFKGRVYAKVIDNAGHVTIKKSDALISDGQKPTVPTVTMKTASGGSYIGNQWSKEKVRLSVSGSTAFSGIREYVYGVKQTGGEYEYTTIPVSSDVPITFDAPENGQTDYEIYAVSQTDASSEKVHVTVKCDVAKPTISAAAQNTAWTKNNVGISLSGSVGSSGLKKLIVKRGEAEVDITSLIQVSSDGLKSSFVGGFLATQNDDYEFAITNGAGNIESGTLKITNIDRTQPPIPKYAITGLMNNSGWYYSKAVINIPQPEQDNGSPIKHFYKLDNADKSQLSSEEKEVTEKTEITLKDGIYNFNLRAEDGVSNKVSGGTQQIKVDSIKPTLEMAFGESGPTNASVINFTVTDEGSGVSYIKYTLAPKVGESKTSKIVADSSGKALIHVWAPFEGKISATVFDRAANASETKSLECTIEANMANTSVDTTIGIYPYDGAWTNVAVTFALSAENLGSSTVTGYEVSLDGTNWLEFTNNTITALGTYNEIAHTFTTTTDQNQPYSFRVVTGTTEKVFGVPVGPITARIDTKLPTPPVIGFKGTEISSGVYKDTVLFTATSSDAESGIQKIEYLLNDGSQWENYNGETAINPQFKGVVKVKVTDNAGNESETTSSVVTVDQAQPLAPTITGTVNSTSYASGTWAEAPVTLTIGVDTAQDPALSGIDHYRYIMDGSDTWTDLASGTKTIEASKKGTTIYRVCAVSKTGVEGAYARFIVNIDTSEISDLDIVVEASSGMADWEGDGKWTNEAITYKLSTNYTGPSSYKYYVKTTFSGEYVEVPGFDTFTVDKDYTAVNANIPRFKIETESGKTQESRVFTPKIDRVKPAHPVVTFEDKSGGENGWYSGKRDDDGNLTFPTLWIAPKSKDIASAGEGIQRSPISTYYTLSKDGVIGEEIELTAAQQVGEILEIMEDGQYVLSSYGRDEVGNVSDSVDGSLGSRCTFKIDQTQPEIQEVKFSEPRIAEVKEQGNLTQYWLYNKTIKVDIIASDATSGVQKIEYQLVPRGKSLQDTWTPYKGLYISPSFKGTLHTKVTDYAGNISAAKTYDLMLNADIPSAPTVEGKVGENPYTEKTWSASDIILTPSGLDGFSDVKYQYNDGSDATWKDVELGGIVANKEGKTTYRVRYKYGSNSENVNLGAPFEVWRDTALPTVTVTAKDSDGQDDTGDWTSKNVVYTISGTSPSGMKFYQSNDKVNWIELTDAVPDDQTTFTLNQDTNGEQPLYFKGITGTGVEAAEPISKIAKIDKTEPAIPEITASVPDTLEGWYKTSGTITVTPSAKDQDGGTRSEINTYYKVGSEEETLYTDSLAFPKDDGIYSYTLRAKDAVGNVSLGTSGVQIHYDQTAPTIKNIAFYDLEGKKIEKIVGSEDQGYFTNAAVYVTVLGNDNLSGMRSIEYYTETVDGQESKKKIVPVDEEGKIVMSLEPHFSGYVYAKPKDMATNEATEFKKSDKITIDQTTPTVTIEPSRVPEVGKWYDKAVDINLTASQATVGLSKVTIKVNDKIVQEVDYSGDESLAQDVKNYTVNLDQAGVPNVVEIIAIDNSGNIETKGQDVFIDNTIPQKPIVSAKIYDTKDVSPKKAPNPQSPVADANSSLGGKIDYTGQWINRSVHVELSGDERIPSGLSSYEYRTLEKGSDEWSPWKSINNLPEKIHTEEMEQEKDYQFRSISIVEHIGEASDVISIKIDKTMPEFISIETYEKEEQGSNNYYAKITASDRLSGVKEIDYYTETLNGTMSPVQTIQSNESGQMSVKLTAGFDGYLYAKARDKASNTSTEYTKSERITIKVTPGNPTDNKTNTVITQLSNNVKTGVQSDAFSILLAIIMIASVGAYFSSKKRNND